MKSILFLILLYNLLPNILLEVKSFSYKQIYSNYFLSNYNFNSIQQYSNYFLSNSNFNSIKQYSNYFLSKSKSKSNQQYSNYFLSKSNQKYSNYYNLLTSNYNSFNEYLSIITSTYFYTSYIHQYSKSVSKSSGKNNEYLSIITSTYFYSSSVSKSLPKSSGKNNEYLSIIKTIPSQYITSFTTFINPTSFTTFNPTFNPTSFTTFNPTFMNTLKPSLKPTHINTFLKPTFIPTLKPSIIETHVLVFDTSITFDNYATIELDATSQKVIILATSNSMNISASYVEYIGSSLKTARRLSIFKIQGYNIIVTLKTTLPLQGQTNPKLLYSTITGNLINSVNSGLFTTYLISASNALGITSFLNSSILSVNIDDYIIKEPNKHYSKSIEPVYTNYKMIYIILGVLLSVYLILYFIWFRKRYLNKIQRLRRLFENMINTDDITIQMLGNEK